MLKNEHLKDMGGVDLTQSDSNSDSGSDIVMTNTMASQARGEDLILDSEDEDGNLFSTFGIDPNDDGTLERFGREEADDNLFAGMNKGRGTRLLSVDKHNRVTGGGKRKFESASSGGGGFAAPVRLSEELSAFLGDETLPRTEVTKRVWKYIKEHNLQDPADKRQVLCDARMKAVLGIDKVHMFTMTKLLSKHMFKESEVNYGGGEELMRQAKRIKSRGAVKEEKPVGSVHMKRQLKKLEDGRNKVRAEKVVAMQHKKKEKKKAKKKANPAMPRTPNPNNPFMKPLRLSPELAELMGETALARPEVVKRMWVRIRERGLQNEADKREILCDNAMRAAFGVDKMTMFSMNKYLAKHLFPIGEEGIHGECDKLHGGVKQEREVEEEEAELD